ncbi:MAG: hypothetical protein RR232_04275 [Clostridia bacterium]
MKTVPLMIGLVAGVAAAAATVCAMYPDMSRRMLRDGRRLVRRGRRTVERMMP